MALPAVASNLSLQFERDSLSEADSSHFPKVTAFGNEAVKSALFFFLLELYFNRSGIGEITFIPSVVSIFCLHKFDFNSVGSELSTVFLPVNIFYDDGRSSPLQRQNNFP